MMSRLRRLATTVMARYIVLCLIVAGIIVMAITFTCAVNSNSTRTRPSDHVRPPCAGLPGSDRDPCDRELSSNSATDPNPGGYGLSEPPLPLDPEWLYRTEWSRGGTRTPQVVLRGIVALNSARCSEIRAYNFGEGDNENWGAESARTREVCNVEIDVSEYIVGTGPSRVPIVVYRRRSVPRSSVNYGTDSYFAELAAPFRDSMEGGEFIFELATPYDFAWGDWRAVHAWDVQRRSDGTIVGVSGKWPLFAHDSEIGDWEYPLDELQRKLKAAHAKVSAEYGGRISDEPGSPMLVADASRESLLAQLRELGAYDAPGITPAPAPTVAPRGSYQ